MTVTFTEHERWLLRRGLPHLIDGYRARTDVWTRAIPALVVLYLLGTLNALNLDWTTAQNVLAFGAAVVIAAVTWVVANVVRSRPAFAVPSELGAWELAVFLGVPTAFPLLFGGQWRSALVTFVGGVITLGLLYVVVSYGLLPMTRWAVGRAADQLATVGLLMARTLPLQSLLLLFFFVNAEAWEVAGTLSTPRFLAVVGTFFVLGVVFVITRLPSELRRLSEFSSWDDARRVAAEAPAAALAVHDGARPDPGLSRREWLNVSLVALVAQGVFITALGLVVFAFLLLFGWIAIPAATQQGWTGLDAVDAVVPWIGITRPHLQVSGFLASFAALSFTVSLVQDEHYRAEFGEEVLGEVRQALAARALAHAAAPTDPDPVQESGPERVEG